MYVCAVCRGSLKDGNKNSIIAKLVDKRESTYQGDKRMLTLDFEDNTGAIQGIVWDDLYDRYADLNLQLGETYRLNAILIKEANLRDGKKRLQIKFWNDTDIQKHSDINLTPSYTDVQSIKEGELVHVRGVVVMDSMFDDRCSVIDETGEVAAYLRPGAKISLASLATGDTVTIDGRAYDKTAEKAFVYSIQPSDDAVRDAALKAFWDDKQVSYVPKRQKVEAVTIQKLADLKQMAPSTRISQVRAVVQSFALDAADTKEPDRVRRKLTVVDDSQVSVGLALFCDKAAEFVFNIGDVIVFDCGVSSYQTLSLTTNAIQKVDDDKDQLATWWKSISNDVAFEELSK